MFRHIFIGTFKVDVDAATKVAELADLKAMREKIPDIVYLHADFCTGQVDAQNFFGYVAAQFEL